MKSNFIPSAIVIVVIACQATAVPPSPVPDASPDKNRYISMSIPSTGGSSVAIRVTLTSLMHPNPPNLPQFPPPNYSAFEGLIRWVGPPAAYPENDNTPATFIESLLQCTPHYENFAVHGLFHVYGNAIVPSSSYKVEVLGASCIGTEPTCADVSAPVTFPTARWGDVVAAFQAPSPPLVQPNATDISAVVDKFDRINANSKSQLQLRSNTPDPSRTVNYADALLAVNAFQSFAYPFTGPTEFCADLPNVGSPRFSIVPGPARGNYSYPSNTSILGSNLHAVSGGFNVFLDMYARNWDPGNTGLLMRMYQLQVDNSGFLGANAVPANPGVNLRAPKIPCTTINNCLTALGVGNDGGNTVACTSGYCTTSWVDAADPNYVFFTSGASPGAGRNTTSPFGPILASGSGSKADDGIPHYIGSIILALPPAAQGLYTISLRPQETFAAQANWEDMVTAGFDSATIQIDLPVIPDPSHTNKNRYLSVVVPTETATVAAPISKAIRVTLETLMHPNPTGVNPPPDFAEFEKGPSCIEGPDGCVRWVGAPRFAECVGGANAGKPCFTVADCPGGTCSGKRCSGGVNQNVACLMDGDCPGVGITCIERACRNGDNPDQFFTCAPLVCNSADAEYRDWGPLGLISIYGSEVVPSSMYTFQLIDFGASVTDESAYEPPQPVPIQTYRWGDVAAPIQIPCTCDGGPNIDLECLVSVDCPNSSCSCPPLTQPNISDVAAIVDRFKGLASAPLVSQADIVPNVPDNKVDIRDVSGCVDAFKGLSFVQPGPTDCSP